MEPTVEVAAKPWYQSKTMIVNLSVTILGIIIAFVPAVVEQQEVLGLSKQAVTIIGLVGTFLGLVNTALRTMTDRPLGPNNAPREVKAPDHHSRF